MMTTDKLAELYKVVLRREEEYDIIKERLAHTPRSDRLAYESVRRQVESARETLASAQRAFGTGMTSYGKIYRNIPFYRKSKTFEVKLQRKTVKFCFNQRGIPTIA